MLTVLIIELRSRRLHINQQRARKALAREIEAAVEQALFGQMPII